MEAELEKIVDFVLNDVPLPDSIKAPSDVANKGGDVATNFAFSSKGLVDATVCEV